MCVKYSIKPIKGESDFYRYEDEYVEASINSISSDHVGIYEWSSKYKKKGGTKISLKNLKKIYGYITVHDIGLEGDESFSYWKHMKELGLVDEIYDDDFNSINEGAMLNEEKEKSNWVILTTWGDILYGTTQGESKDKAFALGGHKGFWEDRVALQGDMRWVHGRVVGIDLKDGRFLPIERTGFVDLSKVADAVMYQGYGKGSDALNESELKNLVDRIMVRIIKESNDNLILKTIDEDAIDQMLLGGYKLPDSLMNFPFGGHGDVKYSIAAADGHIVGIVKIWKSTYNNYPFHSISYFKVADEYQNRGYASKIADEVFRFAKQNNLKLGVHDYTKDGNKKLKKLFNGKTEEYGVEFIDTDSYL